jgi:hypothetical protein
MSQFSHQRSTCLAKHFQNNQTILLCTEPRISLRFLRNFFNALLDKVPDDFLIQITLLLMDSAPEGSLAECKYLLSGV